MIVQALYDYYRRMSLDPSKGMPPRLYSVARVSWEFCISEQGDLVSIVPLTRVRGKREDAPQEMIVPEQKVRTSSPAPNFLCDTCAYVLGLDQERPEKAVEKRRLFVELHRGVLSDVQDVGAAALLAFLQRDPEDALAGPQCSAEMREALGQGGNIVFRLAGDGVYLHERPVIDRAWRAHREADEGGQVMQCLVTGEAHPIARVHPQIKGVSGAQSSGAALVGFNQASFLSYGKEQSYNAPISTEAAAGYVAALNHLLSSEDHRVRIGDMTVVFWADRPAETEESILAALLDPESFDLDDSASAPIPEDDGKIAMVRDALIRLRDGRPVVTEGMDAGARFFVLGLSPNNARLSVRFFTVDAFGVLAGRVEKHYRDTAIVQPAGIRRISSFRTLLNQTAALGKSENVPSTLVSSSTAAMLKGSPYPSALYLAMLSRIRADGGRVSGRDCLHQRVPVLKGYLIRRARLRGDENAERSLTVSLNVMNTDQGYVLGRLFALLEKVQLDAIGKNANATVRDRYMSAASATPARVFPQLMRLAQFHVGKAEYGSYVDTQIAEVLDVLDSDIGFPRTLNLDEQGQFFIGYYQQKQALYTKKSSKDADASTFETQTNPSEEALNV